MRPTSSLVLLLLALSGCTTPTEGLDAAPVGDASGADPVPDRTDILDGTLTWHSAETQGAFLPITLASQPLFNVCVSGDDEVWMSNLDLRTAGSLAPIPDGTTALEVLFAWELADYPRDRLVLAYQPTGVETPIESDWIPNGEPTLVEVEPARGGNWGLWACVSKAGSTTNTDPTEGPKPFLGDLRFRITALA